MLQQEMPVQVCPVMEELRVQQVEQEVLELRGPKQEPQRQQDLEQRQRPQPLLPQRGL